MCWENTPACIQGHRNHDRATHAGAYEQDAPETEKDGTSGPTYKHGFKSVPWQTTMFCSITIYIYTYLHYYRFSLPENVMYVALVKYES